MNGTFGRRGVTLVAALLLAVAVEAAPAPAPDAVYAAALELYRAGEFGRAADSLARGLAAEGPSAGRLALLGWCRLRRNEVDAAEAAFSQARERAPDSAEAWAGLGYVALRRDRPVEARAALRRAVELDPQDLEAQRALAGLLRTVIDERRPRPAADRATPLRVPARATPRGFEIDEDGVWRQTFIVGVNLSTALPGHFPGEFPDDFALYRRWFDQMGELGINTVRLYTLHPPSLYRALASHNAERPERKLWLLQGVWTEPPPRDDFTDVDFAAELLADVRRTIDAIHGNLELPPRAGRAHGAYETDVSRSVLGFVLGREWEPFVVDAFDREHPGLTSHAGRFVRAEAARPTEAWLAELLDDAVAHETEWYRMQHPMSFSTWPTLDPLRHDTESSHVEEQRLRGEPAATLDPYDDDLAQVDPTALRAGPDLVAGLFASYHIYPYHPDFLLLERAYAEAQDEHGTNRYLGYLRALEPRHGDMPVLVAEFGVPTSRGVSHLHPEGLHHGGHGEREQGLATVRLLQSIERAGMAGGLLFSWVDEWFKRNWLTVDFESPLERDPLWLNVLDPEESFGLIAARPGAAGLRIVLDGRAGEWDGIDPLMTGAEQSALRALRVTSDEAYLYVLLEVDAPPREGRREYWIGIDTYDAVLGDHRFPEPASEATRIGLEFLVRLSGPDAGRIDVDRPYDPFDPLSPRPLRSEANAVGRFTPILPETNRERIGRDGTRYAAQRYDRSTLRRGSTDPASSDRDDLADWCIGPDGRSIELRLPWALLNVADPSSRRVVHETSATQGPVETIETDGFRFHVLALDREGAGAQIVARLPRAEAASLADFPSYAWPTWEEPTYHLEPKQSYYVLQQELARRRARDGDLR